MSFVRAAASAAIVTLLFSVCATAKPIATSVDTNLRKGPGTDSEVVTLIPKGTTVEIGKCTNGWCAASLDGKEGFVIGRNVGLGPRPAPRWPVTIQDEIVEEGPPVYARPPVYYRPYPYGYPGYGYPGYYRPWGYGWGWRGW